MPILSITTVKSFIFSVPHTVYYLAIVYMAITVILRCHIILSLVIQSLRLSLSPRLFVIILLRLVSMHSWRLPTGLGLGVLNIQHFSILLGLRL